MVANLAPFEQQRYRQLADNFRRPGWLWRIDHFMVVDGGRMLETDAASVRVGDSHPANSKHRFTTSFLRELEGCRKARLGMLEGCRKARLDTLEACRKARLGILEGCRKARIDMLEACRKARIGMLL